MKFVKRSQVSNGIRMVTAASLAVLLGFCAGCAGDPVEKQPVARPVKMLTLGLGGGADSREYPGKVEAAQNSEMAFEVAGKIVEFPVEEGQRVEKGDVLVRLDPRDFENAAAAARAEMERAKAFRDRILQAAKSDAVSKQDVTDAEARYQKAVADAEIRGKSVADSVLNATFSGIVAKKLVEDFANVQAKQPVLILQDDSHLEIEINFPEQDLRYARPGMSVEERSRRMNPEITVSAFPDRRFAAELKSLSTTADPVTRTFSATFRFENPSDIVIRPGMTAKVVLRPLPEVLEEVGEVAVWIPANAVVADETGQSYVWRIDGDPMKVERTPVKVGELSGANIEVLSGLSHGETIATSGVHHLSQGMEVRRFGAEPSPVR